MPKGARRGAFVALIAALVWVAIATECHLAIDLLIVLGLLASYVAFFVSAGTRSLSRRVRFVCLGLIAWELFDLAVEIVR